MLKTDVLLFFENIIDSCDTLKIIWWIEQKITIYLNFFFVNYKCFTVTLDEFNASSLTNSISSKQKRKKNTHIHIDIHKHIHISAVLLKWLQMPKMLLEANERESYKGGLIEHLKIHPE